VLFNCRLGQALTLNSSFRRHPNQSPITSRYSLLFLGLGRSLALPKQRANLPMSRNLLAVQEELPFRKKRL